ncbi:hypothetical protein ACWDDN_44605 [Streptomyces griseoruber]
MPEHAASASGLLNTAQEGGAAIGVAIAGTLFFPALGGTGDYAHALDTTLILLAAFCAVATLITHGTADLGAPYALCAPRTHELVKDSELITYEGAAHGLFATHADRLSQDLLAFAKS